MTTVLPKYILENECLVGMNTTSGPPEKMLYFKKNPIIQMANLIQLLAYTGSFNSQIMMSCDLVWNSRSEISLAAASAFSLYRYQGLLGTEELKGQKQLFQKRILVKIADHFSKIFLHD